MALQWSLILKIRPIREAFGITTNQRAEYGNRTNQRTAFGKRTNQRHYGTTMAVDLRITTNQIAVHVSSY